MRQQVDIHAVGMSDLMHGAFRYSAHAMALLDLEGTVLDVNLQALDGTSQVAADLVGKPLWEAPWWQDAHEADRLRRSIREAARGARLSYPAHLPGEDRPLLVEISVMPVRGSSGEVVALLAEARDLTQITQWAQDAGLKNLFLDAILDNVQDGIVACDPDGRLTLFNRAARRMHGTGPDSHLSAGEWAEHYDLFTSAGDRHLTLEELPLARALHGERFRGVEIQIEPSYGGGRRTVVCAGSPLTDGTGRLLGAVTTMHDITARKRTEAQLRHDALHDRLTGLPNRALLGHMIEHAIARYQRKPRQVFGLMLLDLDDFKNVNDAYGHLAGDQFLLEVAQRLSGCLRSTDLVARLGGDEFAILLESPVDEGILMRVAERIQAALATPVTINSIPIHPSASIGATVAQPSYTQVHQVLRDADTAMYRAKNSGKNEVTLFDDSMYAAVLRRITTERELRTALAEEQLVLHYQPVIELGTGRCVGFEALVRWQHPERGLLGPGAFLDVAETTGLIVPMGNWVLDESARQLRQWRALPGLGDLTMAANLSGRQLCKHNNPSEHLLAFDFPEGLELEVTESTLTDSAAAVATLEALAARGVPLSLDDFGTGYASLAALERHPISTLKIDRTFVAQLPDGERPRAIIGCVSTLAGHLNLRVVAEGLETIEQVQAIQELGCRYGQGFYFAKPLPADEALAYARRSRESAAG
ncbi:MAG: putative bifunctional diguanylate cyclase/phosphodiesterase [Actinomycetales bacterium]